ncbi:MAG: VWA domain-containing protein, partial [Alphaproteobacteria bacterium]|nr:VWA domain-containing protein [Alphaproteobacteria bacterium]
MFTTFFYSLKKAEIPVSLKEYLTLLEAVKQGVADYSIDNFYFLSRATLVKDERHIDRFDQVFGQCFKGLELLDELFGK